MGDMTINLSIQHSDGTIEEGKILASGPEGSPAQCRIEFRSSTRDAVTFSHDDFFECLVDLRRMVEKEGGLVLCQGARKDVFPSPQMRASASMSAYCLELTKPASNQARVRIFDPVPADEVASIEEQRAFYDHWLDSLTWEKSGDMWFRTDANKTPSPGEIEEAKRYPNGSVSRIRGDYEPDGGIPSEAIEGFWRVDSEGRIFGKFLMNPRYDPGHIKK
jgi:hypothetical protein